MPPALTPTKSPTKKILIFSDGTGQYGNYFTQSNTNIWALYQACSGIAGQETFYDAGLGSSGAKNKSFKKRANILLGLGTGMGISQNIQDCYEEIVSLYNPGDKIYLFGFSRGAYTVRSLAGVISQCGILKKDQGLVNLSKNKQALEHHCSQAIKIYQMNQDTQVREDIKKSKADEFKSLYSHSKSDKEAIFLISAWDTVSALGLPFLNNLFNPFKHKFHDESLGHSIPFAFQALSVDENRKSFSAILWDDKVPIDNQHIEQVYFSGVHSDIGGGYWEAKTSHVSLSWMINKLTDKNLLGKNNTIHVKQDTLNLNPSSFGHIHDERFGWKRYFWRKQYRQINGFDGNPSTASPTPNKRDPAILHSSVLERFEDKDSLLKSPYRPVALKHHPKTKAYY